MESLNLKITDEKKHISRTPDLSSRFSSEEKSKLAKASKDFESLLTSYLVKNLTKTTDGLFGDSGLGGDTMNTIFEGELASFITNSRSMGIADMIYKKLTGEDLKSAFNKYNELKNTEKEETSLKQEIKEEVNNIPAEAIKIKSEKSLPEVVPSDKSINRLNKYDDIIEHAANQYGVDKNIIRSVILAESAGNEKAVSVAKAKGLMQLMDSTAKDMGVSNVWNPKENVLGGTRYLAKLLKQYDGNLKLALAAYNAGPGNVEKYNGVPPFNETKSYITRVMGYINYFNG